jgi:hypothetical protein
LATLSQADLLLRLFGHEQVGANEGREGPKARVMPPTLSLRTNPSATVA